MSLGNWASNQWLEKLESDRHEIVHVERQVAMQHGQCNENRTAGQEQRVAICYRIRGRSCGVLFGWDHALCWTPR